MFLVPSKIDLPGTGEFHHIVKIIGDKTRPGEDYG